MENIMAYPFAGSGVAGVFDVKEKGHAYSTAIQNILKIPRGTMPYNPNYGSGIPGRVFDLKDVITQQVLMFLAYDDLSSQEPRIRIVGVDGDFDSTAYTVTFAVSYIENDDPTETVRVANVTSISVERLGSSQAAA